MSDLQRQFLSLGLNDDPDDGLEDLPTGHYEVERIVRHWGHRHRREYLVKWVGYRDEENSWLSRISSMAGISSTSMRALYDVVGKS